METSTALAIRQPEGLGQRATMRQPLQFTADERQIFRDSFLTGASEAEAKAMIAVAEHMRLNPFKRQIHFVKRWNNDLKREVWAFQTAIDGFRSMAEDTGEFRGSDEPEFSFEERVDPSTGEPSGKKELVARVRVYRKDFDKPFVGVARYTEFVQLTREGNPNRMWAGAPRNMLAKCAEAQAFRKAFPQDLAGVYADDEMPERDVTPRIAPADVQPALPSKAQPVDAEIVTGRDWPALFAQAPTEAALQAELATYQQEKEKLSTPVRKAAQAAYQARKKALAPAPAVVDPVPAHDQQTGEVLEQPAAVREPGSDDA